MPLPGGASDKFGNLYEGRWTILWMVKILEEKAQAISLEQIGEEGEGVEFCLHQGETLEYHQVKRQYGATGHWTIAALGKEGVLSHFWRKLYDPVATCVFASSVSAFELAELADHARRLATWQQYTLFLQAAKKRSKSFEELRHCWGNCSENDAYEALKRVYVRTGDEETLKSSLESGISYLLDGNPENIIDILAQLALESVHKTLTAFEIWHHLDERKCRRREWWKDPRWFAAIASVNESFLAHLRKRLINDESFPREEAGRALSVLVGPGEKRSVLLAGEAGAGKSSIVLQVIESIRKQGWPFLAFRVDHLRPTSSASEVGQQLELPDSPVKVLANIAQGRECLLVIDQLDAVSQTSGRNPEFFECLEKIIEQAQAHPAMHLLLACRKFDMDYDHRFGRLTAEDGLAETVMAGRLQKRTVQEQLQRLGIDEKQVTDRQIELLSLPLHLWLLTEVAKHQHFNLAQLVNPKNLYDQFWDYKSQAVQTRLGQPINWTEIISTASEYMSKHQTFYVPKEHLDRWPSKMLTAMVSEHVFTYDGKLYEFFHPGFFDYAYARRFVGLGLKLLPVLLEQEQHLFRRAQVRQILQYEREADFSRYLADQSELLTHPSVRFHLKQIVFALLASLADPTPEEWNILLPLTEDQTDPRARLVWQELYGSASWFQLLEEIGLIKQWLADHNGAVVNRTVRLLLGIQRRMPDKVAELVKPYADHEQWGDRLAFLMEWSDVGIGRGFFDLFLYLIDNGTLDEARGPIAINSDFWSLISSLPEEHPEWACEVIGHYFNRRLRLSLQAGQINPFDATSGMIPDSQMTTSIFGESSRGAPSMFVAEVLPFMLRVMQLTAVQGTPTQNLDPVWVYRFYGGAFSVESELLQAMETALALLAANEPDEFVKTAELLSKPPFETAQYLLIRAYTANGRRFADQAIDYLCDDPGRLKTGYIDNAHWATRQLIEAATLYCSDERLTRLEEVILNYHAGWEKRKEGRHRYGESQLTLLEGIAPARRSRRVATRLAEWHHKFGGKEVIKAPKSIKHEAGASWVGSPIPPAATEKMTDKQWLSAIGKYEHGMFGSVTDDRVVGGTAQLSRLLENQVKNNPRRFADLVCQFPDTTHPYYFDAVLRGLAEADSNAPTILQVCQRCHQLPNRPSGQWISYLIAKTAQLQLPEEIYNIVVWYATEDPDPEDEDWHTHQTNGQADPGNGIVIHGIHSTRGNAAGAIGNLIFYHAACIPSFLPTLERMTHDSSLGVRACVVEALVSLFKHDPASAIQLFQQVVDADDALLSTHYVEQFLAGALPTYFSELRPILQRMLEANASGAVIVGARLACRLAMVLEEARTLAQQCIAGTEAQQTGAAQIFSALVARSEYRAYCEEALSQLFTTPYEPVRTELATCFDNFKGAKLGTYHKLIQAFIQSPVFAANSYRLITALEQTTAKLPDVTCDVCERFLEVVDSAITDPRTHAAAEVDRISRLVIRVYSQRGNEALQARCLNIIDRMARIGAPRLEQSLAEYDR